MLEILFLSISLAMDAFAISIALSLSKDTNSLKKAAAACFSFGLFQTLFFLCGAFLGRQAGNLFNVASVWIAFILLVVVGGKMIKEGLSKEEEEPSLNKSSFLFSLLLLSIADSIDSGAAGIGMAFSGVLNLIPMSICIGIATFLISAIGFIFGKKLGEKFGKKAEIFGGLVLIGIAVKTLL